MTARLNYYTAQAVEELRESITSRLDWYYDPVAENQPVSPVGSVRESRLPFRNLTELEEGLGAPGDPSRSDGAGALVVFRALSELTPHQASDERLWVYLCHQQCAKYVTWRWLRKRPDRDELAVREVMNHFFARGNRALIRDNGVSRLWWLGRIATDVAPDAPEEFLRILLHRQDVRSALIERPSVSMNRRVLRVIYLEMLSRWANGGKLFEREAFRSWMRALNRRGGVVLLDALPDEILADLVRDEADRAIRA